MNSRNVKLLKIYALVILAFLIWEILFLFKYKHDQLTLVSSSVYPSVTLIPENNLINLTRQLSCPLCFGQDLCTEIELGFIRTSITELKKIEKSTLSNVRITGYYGVSKSVTITVINPLFYNKIKKYMCHIIAGIPNCSLNNYTEQNVASETNIEIFNYFLENLNMSTKDVLPFCCATSNLLAHFQISLDEENNGIITQDKIAMNMFLPFLNLQFLILKFISREMIELPYLPIYGACGQLYVSKASYIPLTTYLNSSFSIRAKIVVQLYTLVFHLMGNKKWKFILLKMSPDSFALVEKELIVLDVQHAVIIENEKKANSSTVHKCDINYLKELKQDILKKPKLGNSQPICSKLLEHGTDLMLYTLCINVFLGHRGLLHNIPKTYASIIQLHLQHCLLPTHVYIKESMENLTQYLETLPFLNKELNK